MPISRDRFFSIARILLIGVNLIVLAALVATFAFIRMENGWVVPVDRQPEDAFLRGTIGTEVMPLPVAIVLPDLFPEHFQPGGAGSGDWARQFGFLRHEDPEANQGLPIGFVATNYRAGTGAPSPVAFVGFSCGVCHSTRIRESEDQEGAILYGPGSVGSSRVDLQACKLEYSIVSPK